MSTKNEGKRAKKLHSQSLIYQSFENKRQKSEKPRGGKRGNTNSDGKEKREATCWPYAAKIVLVDLQNEEGSDLTIEVRKVGKKQRV